jgi:uncharacterized protein YqhQ
MTVGVTGYEFKAGKGDQSLKMLIAFDILGVYIWHVCTLPPVLNVEDLGTQHNIIFCYNQFEQKKMLC